MHALGEVTADADKGVLPKDVRHYPKFYGINEVRRTHPAAAIDGLVVDVPHLVGYVAVVALGVRTESGDDGGRLDGGLR